MGKNSKFASTAAMKFRFTIGRKIGTGFGLFILLMLVVFYLTNNTLNESRTANDEINKVYTPSVDALEDLKLLVERTRTLITNWVGIESREDAQEKRTLIQLQTEVWPELRSRINTLSPAWSDNELEKKAIIFDDIKELFATHDFIKEQINSFESYKDPMVMFTVIPMVEEGGDIDKQTSKVTFKLDELINLQKMNQHEVSQQMISSFDLLQFLLRYLGMALGVGGVLIAIFTVRSIVRPIHQLKRVLLSLGRGVFPKETIKQRNDEIGEMSGALNNLVHGLKQTTDFSKEVGSGNFDYHYEPLSEEDTLGHALLKMRDDLAENERILEQKVIERTEEVVKQRQKLEELYKDLTDSIRYAKRLQESILPSDKYIKDLLPESFVLFKPKDIVSGDFYWFDEAEGKVLFAAVDCTGHGVPGAFMSLVGYNGLKQAVREHNLSQPAQILDDLNALASESLNQDPEESNVRDGMDLALCSLDLNTKVLEYAGAYNPLYIIRNGELMQTKGDKFAIGGFDDLDKKYTNHSIPLQSGDQVYIFSDGYADQFGGPKGKKFMYKQFRDMLLGCQSKTMSEQKDILNRTIEQWKGNFEQVDDILVIGVKV